MKNKVSIIIPTFNRADLIGETLDSLLSQTYKNWECIIVDDGSTDNTKEVVKLYCDIDARIIYYDRPIDRPKGPNSSRNFGIENSTGAYVLSLDSDDWILPEHLEFKVNIFSKNQDIDGVLSKTIMVNNNKVTIRKENRTFLTQNLLEDFISLKVSWYMHDIMWRKSFLNNKILYNEELLKMLDRDFHIRRIAENPRLFLIDKYLSLYRIHQNSNSSNNNIDVAESRHNAILAIIANLSVKQQLSGTIKFYLFKHQVQNLVILYKHPKCVILYLDLINKTFIFKLDYILWLSKLIIGFCSFKIFNKGLRFIQ